MVIGLKCYLGIALPFGILTFFLDLLVPEISRIFIKISSKSEAHNADKIYAYKKKAYCLYGFLFLRYPCKSKRPAVFKKILFIF